MKHLIFNNLLMKYLLGFFELYISFFFVLSGIKNNLNIKIKKRSFVV